MNGITNAKENLTKCKVIPDSAMEESQSKMLDKHIDFTKTVKWPMAIAEDQWK